MKEETKKTIDVLKKMPPGAIGVLVSELMLYFKMVPFDLAVYITELFKESVNRPLPGQTKLKQDIELNKEIAEELQKHIASLTDDEYNYFFSKEAQEEMVEKYDQKVNEIIEKSKKKKILN